MRSTDDYLKLDDPEFFEARRDVREKLERLPPRHADRVPLAELYEALTREFDRRAASAWEKAARTGGQAETR